MRAQEILTEVGKTRDLYNKGMHTKDMAAFEEALEISLRIREAIDADKEDLAKQIDQFHHLDGGLNAHIFNLMKILGKHKDAIPYLEKTLQYLNNNQNPDLWRQLGLLYLVNEQDLDKAVDAWEKALVLDPTIEQRYSGLSVVHVYNAMKSSGEHMTWELLHADIETGEFSVSLRTQ